MELDSLDPHWAWFAIGLILAALEMAIPGVFLIWMAGAALITGAIAWLVPTIGLPLQIVVFAVLAIVSVFGGKRYLAAHPIEALDPKMNDRGAQAVGELVVVTHAIDAGRGFLLLAEHDGRVIAGDLLLSHRQTLTYKFNASDSAYLDLRPNNLLMASAVEMALEDGYRELDLGRCDLDAEGLRRYKLLWGCVEEEYRYYRYDSGPPPRRHRDPVARALPLFVRVAPAWALKLAGDRLYRRFA